MKKDGLLRGKTKEKGEGEQEEKEDFEERALGRRREETSKITRIWRFRLFHKN